MLRQTNTNKVYDHWRRAAAKSNPPSRTAIHPAAIAKALGSTVLLRNPDETGFRFQLAGSRLCAIVGRELAGHPIANLIAPTDQKIMNQGLAAVAQEQAVFVAAMTGLTLSERSAGFESVFMPLIEESPSILGIIEPLAVPLWMGNEPIISFELDEIRMLDIDRELFSLQNRPSIPMPKGPRTLHRPSAARPQLAVIDGNGHTATGGRRTAFQVYDGGKDHPGTR